MICYPIYYTTKTAEMQRRENKTTVVFLVKIHLSKLKILFLTFFVFPLAKPIQMWYHIDREI